jgi:chemotaxis regulatin CheY-phosphate phosphatase CheZ
VAGVSKSQDELGEMMEAAVRAGLGTALDDLRHFVDRRISELSVEIHGTTQLLDFSEANLTGHLTSIKQEIARVVAAPAFATRASGLELEAVVQVTERAANQIMEAAEAIGNWIERGRDDPRAIEAITERLNSIFEACTFQDLTGQRIRRAIEHLQKVETMLGGLAPTDTAGEPGAEPEVVDSKLNPDLGQSDVDRMFG